MWLLDLLEVEDHAHDVVLVLADADLLEQAVADGERAARRGSGGGACREVHPQPVGVADAVVLDLDLLLEVEHHARRGRRRSRSAGRRPGRGRAGAGSGSRPLAAPCRLSSGLDRGRARRVREGLEVGAARLRRAACGRRFAGAISNDGVERLSRPGCCSGTRRPASGRPGPRRLAVRGVLKRSAISR